MSKYTVNISADTKAATKSLKGLDKQINSVTKARSLSFKLPSYKQFEKQIEGIQDSAEEAANSVKLFYRVAKNAPVVGGKLRVIENGIQAIGETAARTTTVIAENNSATKVMGNVATATGSKFGQLIDKFAKLTIVMYGVREVTSLVGRTFGGFFNETIRRAAKFEQTLLKTKTTLASTNRVFVNGGEVLDPLQKINALSGEIGDRVESIRQRSIDLAGVTSNDVVEVFGMVASQISQINGNLSDAEDLAIQFAAALGTFGIPLYQARQEIGSILRGDITVDSYLAKALGITNEDITRAKSETEGVVGFLEKRLAAAVAGQTLAAKGLEGVLSNIRDIYELIAQAIGEPLLDPVIAASTAVYNVLFKSKDLLMDIGKGLGSIAVKASTAIAGAFQMDQMGTNNIANAITAGAPAAFSALKKDTAAFGQLLSETLESAGDAIRTLFTSIAALSNTAIKAFRELFGALIELSLLKFESLLSAFATIAQGVTPILIGLTEMLKIWADILKMPIVQYFGQIAATFAVLKATGVISVAAIITQLVLWAASWKVIVAKVKAGGNIIVAVIGVISKSIGSITALLATLVAQIKALALQQGANSKTVKQFDILETQLKKVSRQAKGASFNFRSLSTAMKTAGRTAGAMALNFIKANAALIAVTLAITIAVDSWGRYTRAQEEARQRTRNLTALDNYIANIGKLSRELTIAEQKAKEFQTQAANTEFDKATSNIKKLKEEIKELEIMKGTTGRGSGSAFSVRRDEKKIEEKRKEIIEEIKIQEKALSVLRRQKAKEEIKTLAQERKGLEKQIIEFRRQLEKDLFQQTQRLRQKELEVFRAQVEIMLLGIQKRNRALIKGEEGASKLALEAFGQYIAQKRSGEMNLEAQKKQLTIEVLNLEQTAIDYRLETEKKIAELRRRVASNDVKQAEAAYAAKTGKEGAGAGNATFGESGRVNNGDPDWVHGHFQTNTGTQMDLINDVKPIIRQLAENKVPMELGYGTGSRLDNDHILGPNGDRYMEGMINKGLALHAQKGSGDGRSFDLFVPKGTRVPSPLSDVENSGGNGGVVGTVPGSGRTWLGHLTPGSKSGSAPQAPNLESLDIPDADKQATAFENQNEKVQDLTRSLVDLAGQAQGMRNDAAFEDLFEQAFPKADIEGLKSQLQSIQEEAKAVLKTGNALTSNEGLINQLNQRKSELDREINQTRAGIEKFGDGEEGEKQKAIEKLNQLQQDRTANLKEEFRIRGEMVKAQNAMTVAIQATNAEQQLTAELGELQLRAYLQMEGASDAQIATEIRKYRVTEKFNKLIEASPELSEELNEALKRQLNLIDQIGTAQKAANDPVNQLMKQYKDNIQDTRGQIASLAQTVTNELGTALSSSISGLIDGTTTVQEAFSRMFENIGKAFIEMATQMLAQKLILTVLQAFSGGGGTPILGNKIGNFGGGNFGGFFADGGRPPLGRPSIIGESGPELFVPDSAGTVISNKDAFGAARGAMRGSNNSSNDAFAENAESIGASTSYTKEKVMERERIASLNSNPIDVRAETTVINNIEYVTVDQFAQGMKSTARDAQAKVLSDLRNRPSTRAQVGMR